jgi:hypothetical protein
MFRVFTIVMNPGCLLKVTQVLTPGRFGLTLLIIFWILY